MMLLGATRSRTRARSWRVSRRSWLCLEHLVEHDEQLVEVERLGQVVGRAGAHRVDRRLDRAERGHHDDARRVLASRGAS